MIPNNVTLIVKAPNQQIEDQNVECSSSWSVKQLKGHLAEVYPSKPSTDEQKIIYSGQLLDDNLILKDVLKSYESNPIAHTMHLVCTPKKLKETVLDSKVTDGLRQRNVTVTEMQRPAEPTPRPEMRQNDQNHSVEMQNYLSSFVNNYGRVPPYPANYNMPNLLDAETMANQMMIMQQAYMQYMQQYANMHQAPFPQAPEAPQQPAPEPPAEEEEGIHRDWLDHLYACSRLAILFSLVYIYGSPIRLLLVLILAAAGYLHQIGFFRDLHLQQHNQEQNNAQRNNAAAENGNNVNANNGNNVNNANNVNNVNNANNGNNVNHTPPQRENEPQATVTNNDNNQQSLLAVTWMIFTSFFASLIPDTN